MFGKPGAGKGTLSARLMGKYDVMSLSTGDLLRAHIAERTTVGKLAEGIMKRGELLPDEVVLDVVSSKLDLLKNKVRSRESRGFCDRYMTRLSSTYVTQHWILDGFPRTLGQGKLLDARLRYNYSPVLTMPPRLIWDLGRKTCH
jgi:nucleoside-triphosphate--adenylate kinase